MNDRLPRTRISSPPPPPPSPWFSVGGDDVRLLRDGAAALPAMLEAIESAKREILLEMYWVGADAVGERFRDVLARRAKDGIRIHVIYDAVGSLAITGSWWYPLTDQGGDVREYHTVSPLHPSFDLSRIEQRDHRKLLVIDGARGFTGGLNLAVQWLPIEQGGQGWRDDMIEVRGIAAQELRTLFYKTWRRITRHKPPPDLLPLRRSRARPVRVLASQKRSRRSIHHEYLYRINAAARSVDIANSYFVPDRSVRNALFRAVSRGARVRVLIPARGDVPIVQFAQEAAFDTLLRHGVELYTMPGPLMHAKTAIIDDVFVTIGSFNLDERSWRHNLEVNISVDDPAFATHVRQWFDRDVARSSRVDLFEWRSRSVARRGVEYVALALRRFW